MPRAAVLRAWRVDQTERCGGCGGWHTQPWFRRFREGEPPACRCGCCPFLVGLLDLVRREAPAEQSPHPAAWIRGHLAEVRAAIAALRSR